MSDRNALQQWAHEFREITNSDPELRAHGRYFSCSYMLDSGAHRVVVQMYKGRVDDIIIDPDPLEENYQFAIRASADTWRKFAEKEPPPMYHGIWSATFRSGMRLEGDLLPLMQNLRCMTRQLELLRETGAPVSDGR